MIFQRQRPNGNPMTMSVTPRNRCPSRTSCRTKIVNRRQQCFFREKTPGRFRDAASWWRETGFEAPGDAAEADSDCPATGRAVTSARRTGCDCWEFDQVSNKTDRIYGWEFDQTNLEQELKKK